MIVISISIISIVIILVVIISIVILIVIIWVVICFEYIGCLIRIVIGSSVIVKIIYVIAIQTRHNDK